MMKELNNRWSQPWDCGALFQPITPAAMNERPQEVLEGMFLPPQLLHGLLTRSPAGRRSARFCKLIGWVASHHFTLACPCTVSNEGKLSPLAFFSLKAEFTARLLLRLMIPARCRSLRLLAVFFFFSFGPQGAKD